MLRWHISQKHTRTCDEYDTHLNRCNGLFSYIDLYLRFLTVKDKGGGRVRSPLHNVHKGWRVKFIVSFTPHNLALHLNIRKVGILGLLVEANKLKTFLIYV